MIFPSEQYVEKLRNLQKKKEKKERKLQKQESKNVTASFTTENNDSYDIENVLESLGELPKKSKKKKKVSKDSKEWANVNMFYKRKAIKILCNRLCGSVKNSSLENISWNKYSVWHLVVQILLEIVRSTFPWNYWMELNETNFYWRLRVCSTLFKVFKFLSSNQAE